MADMAQIDSDGNVTRTRLPRTGYLSDGRAVSNYHKLDSDTLYNEGWREVVDDPPDYDPDTERLRRTGHEYDADDDVVRVVYEVRDRPPPSPDVDGLLDHLGDTLNRKTARRVLDGYVVSAMSRGRWQRAWDALKDSKDDGDLSDDEWDTITQAAEEYHVPGPEDG